jgi:hypothetical protein
VVTASTQVGRLSGSEAVALSMRGTGSVARLNGGHRSAAWLRILRLSVAPGELMASCAGRRQRHERRRRSTASRDP